MNKVGQLGRQGIHGPAEKSEKRILREALNASRARPNRRKSKG